MCIGTTGTDMSTVNAMNDFFITLPFASNMDKEVIFTVVKDYFKKWAFQKEDEKGYVHWHIIGSLIKKRRLQEILPVLKAAGLNFGHMAPMSKAGMGTMYAMKADSRVEGPWTDKDPVPNHVQERFRNAVLRPWQVGLHTRLINMMKDGDDRHILIKMDPDGNIGKSFFKGWAATQPEYFVVPSSFSSANDIIEFCCSQMHDGWKGIIVMDIPRSTSMKHWWTLAAGLETLKSGYLHDKRYRGRVVVIEPPQIVCFCNAMPPREVMSADVFIEA